MSVVTTRDPFWAVSVRSRCARKAQGVIRRRRWRCGKLMRHCAQRRCVGKTSTHLLGLSNWRWQSSRIKRNDITSARISAHDGSSIDGSSLGVTQVGIVTTPGANSVPSYLAGKVDGVDTVGTIMNSISLVLRARMSASSKSRSRPKASIRGRLCLPCQLQRLRVDW